MRTWLAFSAWLRYEWTLAVRYKWDTLAEMITGLVVFGMLALGAHATRVYRAGFGDTLPGLIVGFMVLTLIMRSYRRLAFSVSQEALAGTLEQFAMSPLGALRVWGARAAGIFVASLFFAFLQLALMMLSTGRWFVFDLTSLLPVLLFTYASGQGLGLVMAGCALVQKQVQALFQLGSWTFLALTLFSPTEFPFLKYLPVALGTEMSRRIIVSKQSLETLDRGSVLFLVCHGTAYVVIGMLVFLWAERRARSVGSLGHY